MTDHRALVDRYLRTEFPDASIVDHDDTGHRGRWWSITQHGTVMVLRVSPEFLTGQSEAEAQASLAHLNLARALRGSISRVVVLSRRGLKYVPDIPT